MQYCLDCECLCRGNFCSVRCDGGREGRVVEITDGADVYDLCSYAKFKNCTVSGGVKAIILGVKRLELSGLDKFPFEEMYCQRDSDGVLFRIEQVELLGTSPLDEFLRNHARNEATLLISPSL